MSASLFLSAMIKFLVGLVLTGGLLFLPAGTLAFPGGLRLMAVLFVPMFAAGIVMMVKNPGLLASRLQAKESEQEQKWVIRLSGLMCVTGFVLAGLDFRFSWSPLPVWFSRTAGGIFLVCYGLYGEVLRENTYLSRTVRVQEGQTVVDTGLYGVVRHPMYAATVVMFLMIPLTLGSWISLIPFLGYPFVIGLRIRNEEQVLSRELAGYDEYRKKVRFRLTPYIW